MADILVVISEQYKISDMNVSSGDIYLYNIQRDHCIDKHT